MCRCCSVWQLCRALSLLFEVRCFVVWDRITQVFFGFGASSGQTGSGGGGEGWADILVASCFMSALRSAFWYRSRTRPIMIQIGSMFHSRPSERASSVVVFVDGLICRHKMPVEGLKKPPFDQVLLMPDDFRLIFEAVVFVVRSVPCQC